MSGCEGLRYKALEPTASTAQQLIGVMERQGVMKAGWWVMGHSKLLMKHEQSAVLGAALAKKHHAAVVLIQRHARGWWQVDHPLAFTLHASPFPSGVVCVWCFPRRNHMRP
jgi:hypothetical protein